MNFSMRAKGKLLLTGEYFVTEGATALALPCKLGQSLRVQPSDQGTSGALYWKSGDAQGNCWFSAEFALKDFDLIEASGDGDKAKTAARLQELLRACRRLNPHFLTDDALSLDAETELEFPLEWGLGSSSTLVVLMARWAEIDPFALLEQTFGGSGYDIAAATAEQPLLFRKFNGKNQWEPSRFDPPFADRLYFVHLNQKRDSREALAYYMVTPADERAVPAQRISQITHNVAAYCSDLSEFEKLLDEHETLVQSVVRQPKAKDLYFSDYWGQVKSLGAWGGDFVLATSNRSPEETRAYFESKGFATFIPYRELVQ